ncbi:hypothetical protein TWF730_006966 [Orbilia blumenaviensis]|uniref:Uncharacterized protein n=1 Tax=Orbilia blumenaviensis TaxID=1796055 RepID=A0AAV9VM38_9PEZI
MSRDLLGEFGDFQSNTTNPVPTSTYPSTFTTAVGGGGGGGYNDLLGLFGPAPVTDNTTTSASTGDSTTLFTASPHHAAISNFGDDDDDDDFGDFAVEPLPSSNPSYGPFSNTSPTLKPSLTNPPSTIKKDAEEEDEEFGGFIYTPRIPTPPPTQPAFSLSTTLTSPNHLHPSNPPQPPAIHKLLPLLTTHLLSPQQFLTRLKPLSYPAKQRLLNSVKVKEAFRAVILVSYVVARVIAGKKVRGRRNYGGKVLSPSSSNAIGGGGKGEAMKDEREIAECVREYNEILGSLRAVARGIAGVAVIDLGVEMAVSSSSVSVGKKGGLGAGKGEFCWLCGLLSTDRVVKLKEGGDDGFEGVAEWVVGWGHRGCWLWWGENSRHFPPTK